MAAASGRALPSPVPRESPVCMRRRYRPLIVPGVEVHTRIREETNADPRRPRTATALDRAHTESKVPKPRRNSRERRLDHVWSLRSIGATGWLALKIGRVG